MLLLLILDSRITLYGAEKHYTEQINIFHWPKIHYMRINNSSRDVKIYTYKLLLVQKKLYAQFHYV